jgi:hypothetical protein
MTFHSKHRMRSSTLVLCTLLLLVAGFVQAAHSHGSDLGASKHCSTCVVSHSAVSQVVAVQAVSHHVPSELVASAPDAPVASRVIASARIRPPPAAA